MTRSLVVSVLGILFVTLLSSPVQAAAETFHFSSHGEFADASLASTDQTGCIDTNVSVAVASGVISDGSSNYLPEPTANGGIGSLKAGEVTVSS